VTSGRELSCRIFENPGFAARGTPALSATAHRLALTRALRRTSKKSARRRSRCETRKLAQQAAQRPTGAALDAALDAHEAALLAALPAAAWLFAYGSLLWRPDVPFVARRRAVLRGHARRFAQASPDHRGVPGAEGRVATLLPVGAGGAAAAAEEAEVHGDAFLLPPGVARETLARLARRERAGYTLARVRVLAAAPDGGGDAGGGDAGGGDAGGGGGARTGAGAVVGAAGDDAGATWLDAVVFVGASDNPFFVRGEDEAAIAAVVGAAAGPSGANVDYFASLLHAMRGRGVRDAHLEGVAAALEPGALAAALGRAAAAAAAAAAAEPAAA